MKENNRLVMDRCGVLISYRCNLKCKLCAAYAPYYQNPPHFSYELICKALYNYFDMIQFVNKFTISGGEPMLHTELDKIIECVETYSNKIGYIEIVTNGTVVPNSQLLSVLIQNKENISFTIDNYGSHLSKKIPEMRNVFDKYGIKYVVRENNAENPHCGGWVDFGDFQEVLYKGKENIEEHFLKCALPQKMHFCFTIKGNELHPCGPSYRCMEIGVVPKEKGIEYVDLMDEVSTESRIEQMKRIMEAKSLRACAYCKGMCADSERFIPAEQL